MKCAKVIGPGFDTHLRASENWVTYTWGYNPSQELCQRDTGGRLVWVESNTTHAMKIVYATTCHLTYGYSSRYKFDWGEAFDDALPLLSGNALRVTGSRILWECK
jgi:hypothetical protein